MYLNECSEPYNGFLFKNFLFKEEESHSLQYSIQAELMPQGLHACDFHGKLLIT
jgi:hypothetical protein